MNLITILKNSQVGQVIYSSAHEMSISFWTAKLEGHRGFKLKYSSEESSGRVKRTSDSLKITKTPMTENAH